MDLSVAWDRGGRCQLGLLVPKEQALPSPGSWAFRELSLLFPVWLSPRPPVVPIVYSRAPFATPPSLGPEDHAIHPVMDLKVTHTPKRLNLVTLLNLSGARQKRAA